MSISAISFRSNSIDIKNKDSALSKKVQNQPKLESSGVLREDVVEIENLRAKSNDDFKNYSCKGADMLKYDLEYSKPSFFNRDYEITGDGIELKVNNKFVSTTQKISGIGFGEDVDISIKSGAFSSRKGVVTGKINGQLINFKYKANENAKSINISGDIDVLDEKNKNLLIALISDKIQHDLRLEQEMEMVALAGTIK